ncbi:hypothetical protein BBF96_04265 [Anoxybacter fermentans]|uniref:Uncharacterized protein n=1 Tax=Anoxybacter fermentans TaxID=1323375 RepID=A0A3Q9HPL3_9FIRM|nr:OadG family protein [Anoxybacter fermentans]AZR72671.1 hypothetical protein BBF96_04265 [Anoxybacter fermentans]
MDNISLGLQLTFFGMGAVFLALTGLAIFLDVLKKVVDLRENFKISISTEKNKIVEQKNSPHNSSEDIELVAVITGAIAALMEEEKGYVPNFKIASITPVSNVWKMQGRFDLIK